MCDNVGYFMLNIRLAEKILQIFIRSKKNLRLNVTLKNNNIHGFKMYPILVQSESISTKSTMFDLFGST